MKFYQETTDYGDKIANGVYLLSDDKTRMYAYVSPGSKVAKEFSNFIRIDVRGRKFKEVANTFGYVVKSDDIERWTVEGSKGATYTIERVDNQLRCSCAGFQFRGTCKHINTIALK